MTRPLHSSLDPQLSATQPWWLEDTDESAPALQRPATQPPAGEQAIGTAEPTDAARPIDDVVTVPEAEASGDAPALAAAVRRAAQASDRVHEDLAATSAAAASDERAASPLVAPVALLEPEAQAIDVVLDGADESSGKSSDVDSGTGVDTESIASKSASAAESAQAAEPLSITLPTDGLFGSQFYLLNTAPGERDLHLFLNQSPTGTAVWEEFTGAGVKVGVIDDGIDFNHPDLNDNYDASLEATGKSGFHPAATDAHGTAVSGIIASELNGVGTVGVAYGAHVTMMAAISDAPNITIPESYVNGLKFDVINNSWGFTTPMADQWMNPDAFFTSARNALWDLTSDGRGGLGTVFVKSAGNSRTSGDNTNFSFTNSHVGSIAVAAVNRDGTVTTYSTEGASLLVSSFGTPIAGQVVTTDRVGAAGYDAGDYTSSFNGTSAAAPMVTGIVALMLDANPNLGYRDVADILALSARHTGTAIGSGFSGSERYAWEWNHSTQWNGMGMHFSEDYGFGLVDALAAVRLAESWTEQNSEANRGFMFHSSTSFVGPINIPDANLTGITVTFTAAAGMTLEHVVVDLGITQTFTADLEITLTSPSGTVSQLLHDNGGSADIPNYGTFDLGLFSTAFRGEQSGGTWTLNIADDAAADLGVLSAVQMEFSGSFGVNDTFVMTEEASVYVAGVPALVDTNGGTDTLNASAVFSNSTIDLSGGSATTIDGKSFTLNGSIENAIGGDGNDTLLGTGGGNLLRGYRGNDTINGGAGVDTTSGGTGNDRIVDTDFVTFDVHDGGAGTDWIDYSGITFADGVVTIDLAAALVTVSGGNTETITGFENVDGSQGGETIFGNSGANFLRGNGGNDTINGQAGSDTVDGGAGNDRVFWGPPIPFISDVRVHDGGADVDTIDGGGITFGSVAHFDLGAGIYTIGALFTESWLNFENYDNASATGDEQVTGTAGANSILTGSGANVIAAGDGNDSVNAGAGNDRLDGGNGTDTLLGGDGDDVLIQNFGGPNEVMDGGTGNDTGDWSYSTFDAWTFDLVAGTATIGGTAYALLTSIENVVGGQLGDSLIGDGGNNRLDGQNGNDTIDGGSGTDTLLGGDGDDVLIQNFGGPNEVMDGGAGNDTGDWSYSTGDSWTFDLVAGTATIFGTAYALLTSIENVVGGQLGDSLVGDSGNNRLDGQNGDDTINAGAGADTVLGGAGNDVINGQGGSDSILGEGGDDRVFWGPPIPALSDVRFHDGGADTDTIDGGGITFGSIAHFDLAGGIYTIGALFTESWLNFENYDNASGVGDEQVTGTAGANLIVTGSGNNVINAGAGADTVLGGGGNDVINGQGGSDSILGEAGDDRVFWAPPIPALSDVRFHDGGADTDTIDGGGTFFGSTAGFDLGAGTYTNGGSFNESWLNFENYENGSASGDEFVTGSAGANRIVTGSGNNVINAGAGADTVLGGAGNDVINGQGGSDSILGEAGDDRVFWGPPTPALSDVRFHDGGADVDTIDGGGTFFGFGAGFNLGAGTYTNGGSFNESWLNFENYENGSAAGNEFVTGSAGANRIVTGSGTNLIDGGGGVDTMIGGDGNDTYVVSQIGDLVTETNAAAAGGRDLVQSNLASYTLTANVEDGRIMSAGAANMAGNGLDNTLYAGAGNNFLGGSGGTDTASYLFAGAAVTVSLAIAGAQATGGSGTDTLSSIENLNGSNFADTLTGNSSANVLDGGLGVDTMNGGDGSDTYVVSQIGDLVVETNAASAGGRDLVQSNLASYTLTANVEDGRIMSAGAANMAGNGLDNTLYAGAGNNFIGGQAGIDTASYLHAGSAVTVNLSIVGAQATGGSGTDTLTGIENLNGSNFNDTLTGSALANIIDGGLGVDTMTGGDGGDTYVVSQIGDLVVETNALAAGGRDLVQSFLASYTLTANVEDGRIMSAGAANMAGNALNNTLYAGAGNNFIGGQAGIDTASYVHAAAAVTINLSIVGAQATGGSGTDTLTGIENLNGSNFNDTLTGSALANIIDGGLGVDTMTGGDGGDTYVVSQIGDLVVETNPLAAGGRDLVQSNLASYTLTANVEDGRIMSAGAANMAGNGLNNTLYAGAGNNFIGGQAGIDTASYLHAGSAVTVNLSIVGPQATGGSSIDTLSSIENLTGSSFSDVLIGNAGANTLTGGAGSDTVAGLGGADVFTLSSLVGSDTITDFVSGLDKIAVSQAGIRVGDGDTVIDLSMSTAGPGGFLAAAELVVITGNIGGPIDAASAAAAIGNAAAAYAIGAKVLFAVDNGVDSALMLFNSSAVDATVGASELTLLARLIGTPSTSLSDFVWVG